MGFFAAFLATGFLAAFFAAFLAAGFFAAFLAAGFFAAFFAGFLAFLTTFFAGFLAFLTFLTFSTFASLKDPFTGRMVLAANIFLMASLTRVAAFFSSPTLLLARTALRMAWRDEPPRSFKVAMAAAIMAA